MDTLRGGYDAWETREEGENAFPPVDDIFESDDTIEDAPPPEIGSDERRMQVRAYNYWASALADRNYPSIDDLHPGSVEDFGPNSVLLDFSQGVEDPIISYVGDAIVAECEIEGHAFGRLSDVPSRSLLSRITDHYMQILANQAPIGFEAEFVNQKGKTVLYRGILLPYSSDDDTIDFIYGVINWKELADQKAAEELLLAIDNALETPASPLARKADLTTPLVDWADAPVLSDEPDPSDGPHLSDAAGSSGDNGMPQEVSGTVTLADQLADARDVAAEASRSEERSRTALYDAIGKAWDFALAAADAPYDFAQLLENAGLTVQKRAPMTPIVKLVFGAHYDKTRLTEYAAALSYAQRIGLAAGDLSGYLQAYEGGLRAVVAAERSMRREDAGKAPRQPRSKPRAAIARKLRALDPQGLETIASHGEEFALVMVKRTAAGEVLLLGEIDNDVALLERAARKLIG